MSLILEVPINRVSFGNVAFNIVRELYKREYPISIFPIGQPDFSAFDLDDGLKKYFEDSINNRFDLFEKDTPSFKLWHLNGSENRKTALGLDEDFKITEKKYLEDTIHFGLMGKFENRKHTQKIIKACLKKYGNNNKYLLTCCINNPFFKPEQMQGLINDTLAGKHYNNINFLPVLEKNREVNQ